MLAETPLALRYLLSEDVYLLPGDKAGLLEVTTPLIAEQAIKEAPAVVAQETVSAVSMEAIEEVKIPKLPSTEPKASIAEQLATAEPQFVALGNNEKNILVLVKYPDQQHMADAHLHALEGAFLRLGHTRTNFSILNIARYPAATFEQISGFFKPQVLLILGADSYPQGLPPQPFNQLREGKGGRKLLSTYSFNEMLGDREKTRAYWEQMKNI